MDSTLSLKTHFSFIDDLDDVEIDDLESMTSQNIPEKKLQGSAPMMFQNVQNAKNKARFIGEVRGVIFSSMMTQASTISQKTWQGW